MGSLLVVLVVSVIVFSWLRAARRNRERWLQRLDLPGSWSWEGHQGRLELSGGFSAGSYRLLEPGVEHKGNWQLRGHTLELTAKSGDLQVYDLRFFDKGKIGLSRDGRDARVYVKTPSNVVPLRSRSG
jgi:hypothetical protein